MLAAIGALSASSLRAGGHVENHLADVENAQQILAGLPGRGELANRTSPARCPVTAGDWTLRRIAQISSTRAR